MEQFERFRRTASEDTLYTIDRAAITELWTRSTSVKRNAVKGGLISGTPAFWVVLLICLSGASAEQTHGGCSGGADTILHPVAYFAKWAVPGAEPVNDNGTLYGIN